MNEADAARSLTLRFVAIAVPVICALAEAMADGPRALPGEAAGRGPLTLTYVANAGVMVASGGRKVLIDALFDAPNTEYRAPAPEVIEKMLKNAAPFDGVDLVLVTHNHPDHFDARLVARYLEAVSRPMLAAPADAVEVLREVAADWARIGPRVVPFDLAVGKKAEKEIATLGVTAFRTLHGDRDAPNNVMYLIELGGWRIFHEGDSPGVPDEATATLLAKARVDLALVHFWFPLDPACARFLQESLVPAHIALTHLPVRLEGDAPAKIDMVRKYYGDIRLLLPGTPDLTYADVKKPR